MMFRLSGESQVKCNSSSPPSICLNISFNIPSPVGCENIECGIEAGVTFVTLITGWESGRSNDGQVERLRMAVLDLGDRTEHIQMYAAEKHD